ncbi:MAG TPA: DUF4339 domain-containing protein [Chitinophagaceae bacterium]|jgi:hypothetical protein|nr:DUF4339 domain-containing protein [Chitinophagaceae bacterium]
MKKYYFFDGTTQHGPFTLDELRTYNITPKTSVWFDAIPQWKPAGEIPELQTLFSNAAAPVPGNIPAPAQEDWNSKDFYFADNGGAQQGPFKLHQLAGKNITAQTHVWYDPLPKWTTAGEVPALKNILSTVTQAPQTDWNNKDFYYTDSAGTQQGPFKLHQLAGKNVTAQTHVWYDPLPNWTTAGEVPALKSIISSAATVGISSSTTHATQTDWNAVDFYYLDGAGTQQGPFKLNQLGGKNINAQTQVWHDPLPNWTTAGQVPALKSIIENTNVTTATVASSSTHTDDWSKKQFFIADSNGTQEGPLTLKQLEDKNITEATSVWYDPLPNWTTAGEVPALKKIIDAVKAKMSEWKNKFYFFTDANGTRQGPFKLDQLKDKNITAQTPIWYDPLTEWTTAGEVAALKEIISN